MTRLSHWIARTAAFAMLLSLTATTAVAVEYGSVSGTVMNTDGKPAEGARVRLMNVRPKGEKKVEGSGPPVALMTTYADKDGKFEMKEIPPGNYFLEAGFRHISGARHDLAVAAGKNHEVAMKLKAIGEGGEDGDSAPAGGDQKGKGGKKGKKAEGSNE